MKRSSIRLITLAALSTACLAASLFGTVQAAPAPNAKLPVVAVQAVEMLPQTVSRRLAGRGDGLPGGGAPPIGRPRDCAP